MRGVGHASLPGDSVLLVLLCVGNLFSPFCGSLAVSGLQLLCGRYQIPRLRERQAALLRELKVAALSRSCVHVAVCPALQRSWIDVQMPVAG